MAAAADPTVAAVGPRVKALREAMDLSLRDLAERSGVSAPMLSQVERGETSPTLQIASRIASGLELRLSQLLRLDEEGTVSIVRAGEGRRGGAGGHAYELLTPPLPGLRAEVTRHTLAPGAVTGGPGDPPRHEPGARETTLVEQGAHRPARRRRRARIAQRGLRDLRRRPVPSLRQSREGGGSAAGHRVGRPAPLMTPTTLFEKIWSAHEISPGLIFIDLHLVHEVTSPQAFEGLRLAGREVRRPDRTLATADHNVPTDGTPVSAQIRDALSRRQVEALEANCDEFGIPVYSLGSERQGIVHIIGPELGVTQPGMTIVCGDSHTATHGAFGALAFGIGTSEVEHVLATQTLQQPKPKSMRINYVGELGHGVTAKDLILGTIGQMGTNGAAGHVVEFAGDLIKQLSMEQRMTICNMTIEGGGRAGMIAPDETTFEWVQGPPGRAGGLRGSLDVLAHAADRRRRDVRPRDHRRRVEDLPVRHLGHHPGPGRRRRGRGAVAEHRDRRALAGLHGPGGGHADHRAHARPRVHRLLHERPHRRPARRRGDDQGPQGRLDGVRDGRPGLGAGGQAGRVARAWTRSSARPASTGAPRAARCAWA